MGTNPEDPVHARLLSGRNEPSVLEQEAIFERVLQNVADRPWAPWRRAWPVALAAAAALLIWLPLRDRGPAHDEPVARGDGQAGTMVVGCSDEHAAPAACAPGVRVNLELSPPANRSYFALLAQRPDGKIVWYYPKQGRTTQPVAPQLHLHPESPVIAADAPPGRYLWLAVFSHEALTRAELKSRLKDDLTGEASLTVIRRNLLVKSQEPAHGRRLEATP